MLSKVGCTVVRYYMAIRISAGAAVVWLPDNFPPDRTPIVRTSDHALPDGFDRREIIIRSGRQYVVTLAGRASGLGRSQQILPN
jgi:hypothetical protein